MANHGDTEEETSSTNLQAPENHQISIFKLDDCKMGRWWQDKFGAGGMFRGNEVSLLTGVLPKSKSRGNPSLGEGYKPSFAGVFALLRLRQPRSGTWATRRDVVSYEIRVGGLGWIRTGVD